MTSDPAPDLGRTTRLLNRYGRGDRSAEEELLASVYEELRALARGHMGRESAPTTLQPTALIHEAWLRLARQEDLAFDAKSQFYRLASKVMRSILLDRARAATREKRGGGRARVSLDAAPALAVERNEELIALEESLARLEAIEPELARVVEMRFFGGLGHEEIARALGVSLRTVERHWRAARAWLHEDLAS